MTPEELKLSRQRLYIETTLKQVDQKLARDQFEFQSTQQFEFQKKKEAPNGWSALLTPTGGILVAAAIGLVGTAVGKFSDNEIETKKQQTAIILKAIDLPAGVPANEQQSLRNSNLLWFVDNGFLTLPKDRIAEIRTQLGLKPSQSVPPPTIASPTPAIVEVPDKPNYNLSVPPQNPGQSNTAYKLLTLAVSEINRNIDRQRTPDRIREYWKSVSVPNPDIRLPWSGAFVSWLIQQVAPDQLKPDAWIQRLWETAQKAGLAVNPPVPFPGDIVVIRRMPEEAPAHIGVVYGVDGDQLMVISGNANSAVRLNHFIVSNVVGYIRLKD